MTSLATLPDELIQQILHHIPAEDTLSSVALVSRRFNNLAEERLLWKYYCQAHFRYWRADHGFWDKMRTGLHGVDWKALYILRLKRNSHIASLLDGIIASNVSRLEKTEQICRYGYDAKDYLLTQSRVDDSLPDALARSYYSCAALNSIHRSLAIEEWAKFNTYCARHLGQDMSTAERLRSGMTLERALGAFDMFMLHDNEGDLDETSKLLDDVASRVRAVNPHLNQATTREKAIALAQWLHANNIRRLHYDTDHNAQYLRNCLIGRALRDKIHPSLPIVSAAIYSLLASRLGFEAYPCSLPTRAHTIVLSPRGVSLDGERLHPDEAEHQKSMFLDPYASPDEVPVELIKTMLTGLGIYGGHHNLLVPTSTDQIVIKTARNVMSAFTNFRTYPNNFSQLIPLVELDRGDWARNLQHALYSVNWAEVLMAPIHHDMADVRWGWERNVRKLLTCIFEHFPEDAWLIEKYIYPMYEVSFASPSRLHSRWEMPSRQLRLRLQRMRLTDASIGTPRRRSDLPEGTHVKFRIGQVFRHKRYDYYGVIMGWSTHGAGTGTDMRAFGQAPDREGGKHSKPYYSCLVGIDGSNQHIIAEHNIQPVNLRGPLQSLPSDIKELIPMAGKYFKRWDGEMGVFVSNVREFFPED